MLVLITAGGALFTLGALTKNDSTQQETETAQIESYPRVAVLQFANKSGDSSNDFLEGGLQLRLMHDLSRFKTMRPLKYDRSYDQLIKNDIGDFDYAVTGVILPSETQADVMIELTDLENMAVIENHQIIDGTLGADYVEAFEDIISEISEDLAAIDGDIMKAELLKIQKKPESLVYTDLTALECFSKFFDPLMSPNPEIYERNYTCFKTLSETYPKDSTLLAAYGMTMQWGATSSEEEFAARALDPTISEERAGALLKKAVELDPSDSFAQIALAYYFLDIPDIKGALVAANTAHLGNPADTDALSLLSTVLAYDGQWDRALMKADEAKARDPKAFYVYYRTYFMKALLDNDKAAMAKYCAELRESAGSSADVFCYLSVLANNDLRRLPLAESYMEEYAREVGTDKVTAINDYLKSAELREAARKILSNANVAMNDTPD